MGTHLSKTPPGGLTRTFVAVELPPAEKERLSRLERAFVTHASMCKWAAPDVLHITVRFLGGLSPSQLAALEVATRHAAARVAPFSLGMSGLGAFPNQRLPRVIWVGLQEDQGLLTLRTLHAALEAALTAHGFAGDDRPFTPHITLARVRDSASLEERRALGETLFQAMQNYPIMGSFTVRNVVIMRSDLGSSGPRYTPMASLPLGQTE